MIIKVCGLKNPTNVETLTKFPINWMGFIFYKKSSRFVDSLDEPVIANIIENTKEQKRVGVFVDETIEQIRVAVEEYKLNIIQLHGNETPAFIEILKADEILQTCEIIKAFSIGPDFDFERLAGYEKDCDYFLFDTKGKLPGGTGLKFNWNILTNYQGETPFLLSGGIGPEDVAVVKQFQHDQCVGIDINSRFEDMPGLKNTLKIKRFLKAIL